MKRVISSSLVIIGVLVIGLLTWTMPAESKDTPGSWKKTGSMKASRRFNNVWRLTDGRILVVGGADTTGVDGAAKNFYATAEIYDPVTGNWTPADSLKTGGRALFTVNGLLGSKILFTGGWNGSAALSSAEIYDPDTGTFSPTDSMTTARANHRSIRLFNGKILITGGFDSSGTPLASAEIYDPTTGIFEATAGPMAAARSAHSMNTVGEGKVLIAGGFGAGGAALASAELFDPATRTFSPTVSLAHARARHVNTTLPTGKILMSGGHGEGGVLASTELYDPEDNTFSTGPNLLEVRKSHSAQVLPNGLVLISGGNNNPSAIWDIQRDFLSSCELYDPATDAITPTGSKTSASSNGSQIILWNGKFLSAGGGRKEAELYVPEMPGTPETWVATTGNMVTARSGHLWTLLDDGRVFIAGGVGSASNPLDSAELYDYVTGNFIPTENMSTPRQHHRTVLLYTGKVLVTGGRSDYNSSPPHVLNSAVLFDPGSGTFAAAGTPGTMLRYRRLHRTTELSDGKILITGGLGGTSNTANLVLTTVELYDPAMGTFTQTTGGLNIGRYNHQAILLYTGKVLIVGGVGTGSVVLNSAELYDPDTKTFSEIPGGMITARNSPSVNTLPDGRVLVSSGTDSADTRVAAPVQSLEIYDPATNSFTTAGNGLVARGGDRVLRLAGGKVILVGGKTTAGDTSVTDSAELYNYLTGTFSATGSLITGRQSSLGVVLPNGRVLVAGGTAADGTVLASAELYTPSIADIGPTSPDNGATFDTCSYFTPPIFEWDHIHAFQKVELQFYTPANPTKLVKVKVTDPAATELQMVSNTWKKILALPGLSGGEVNWKIVGTNKGLPIYESDPFSLTIAAPDPVDNPNIDPTSQAGLPTLTWGNACGTKFKAYFSADEAFSKKKTLSFTDKNPVDEAGNFSSTLTSGVWTAIRKLVGDVAKSTIYWYVESWDVIKRYGKTDTTSFTLEP